MLGSPVGDAFLTPLCQYHLRPLHLLVYERLCNSNHIIITSIGYRSLSGIANYSQPHPPRFLTQASRSRPILTKDIITKMKASVEKYRNRHDEGGDDFPPQDDLSQHLLTNILLDLRTSKSSRLRIAVNRVLLLSVCVVAASIVGFICGLR